MNSPIDTIRSITGKEIEVFDKNYDNSKMTQEDFLKVLLANFQYQDPFEAEDISKFIDNTLNLRELETMSNFENAVNRLVGGSSSTLLLQASNLINEKVTYEGDKTYIQNHKGKIEFSLKKSADIVELYIYDFEGNIVKKETFSDLEANTTYPYIIEDEALNDGYYKVGIVAKNRDENVESIVYSEALITGIRKEGDKIVALYEYGDIDLDSIGQIGG